MSDAAQHSGKYILVKRINRIPVRPAQKTDGIEDRRFADGGFTLAFGDTVDCWRVEALEPNRPLRLAAEMKVPGRA